MSVLLAAFCQTPNDIQWCVTGSHYPINTAIKWGEHIKIKWGLVLRVRVSLGYVLCWMSESAESLLRLSTG